MKFLKRDVLRAGTYVKNGQQVTVTPADVRQRFDSILALRQAGLHVPLVREHTDPNRQLGEGLPGIWNGSAFQYGDAVADELKRTVGAVDLSDPRSGINSQGGLDLVFDVPDRETAKQLHDKRIRFVSPELRRQWVDGKGNNYQNVMTHVALTHRPIQVDQAAGFQQVALSASTDPTIHLSCTDQPSNFAVCVDDFDVCQFDDTFKDDDHDSDPSRTPSNAPPPSNTNPNMPKEKSSNEQIMEAINAHLQKLGIRLPEDTDPDDFMRTLLTALMTKVASDDQSQADEAKKKKAEGGDETEVEEQMPHVKQFSDDSPHGKLLARINALRAANALPAGMGDTMLLQLSSVEFDEAGAEKVNGGLSITALCDLYEKQATQFADGSPQSRLAAEIDNAAKAGTITPGESDQLKGRIGSIQFADDGSERIPAGAMGIRHFLAMSAQRGNAMATLLNDQTQGATATQFSDGGNGNPAQQFAQGFEAAHPGGDQFVTGDQTIQVGDPRAKAAAEALLERTGMKPKGRETVSLVDQANTQMADGAQPSFGAIPQ